MKHLYILRVCKANFFKTSIFLFKLKLPKHHLHLFFFKYMSWNMTSDLQEFSRRILDRWQSRCSSIRSSNLGLRPGSEVSSLSWHTEAVWPIRPSLREGERKTMLTVLQCQVSAQIALQLVRLDKGRGEGASQVKDCNHPCLGWQSAQK